MENLYSLPKDAISRCKRTILLAIVAPVFFLLAMGNVASAQTLTADQNDYIFGTTATFNGCGFLPGETVSVQVLHSDGKPNTGLDHLPWNVTADPNGCFVTTWCVCDSDAIGSSFIVTAIGLSSSASASAAFTDAGVSFTQCANANHPTAAVSWINGILNPNNSDYFEGIGVPQKLILDGITPVSPGNNTHTLLFSHQCVKGGAHAYDFLISWAQAIQTAGDIGNGSRNELAQLFQQACNDGNAVCNALNAIPGCSPVPCDPSTDPRVAYGVLTSIMNNPPHQPAGSANVNDVIACWEAKYGPRKIEVRGNAPVSNVVVTFTGYTAGGSDDYANYSITWTSASDQIMIRMAGRPAQGPIGASTCGYGTGLGAGSISGGPYHFKLGTLDGHSLGSMDNQLQSNATPVPPVCDIIVSPSSSICLGQSIQLSLSTTDGTAPFNYSWTPIGATTQAVTVSPTTTTTYTATVTDANQSTCQDTVTVTVVPPPTPTISETDNSGIAVNDGIICSGDCAGLSVGTFNGYSWSTGATSSAITVCPTVTTTYTVIVTGANGCTAATTTTITVNAKATPSITETDNSGVAPNDGIICIGDCAGLNAGGGFISYVWNTGATSQTINVCPTTTTTYTVTVVNANGCSGTGTSTVIVNPLPTPSITETDNSGIAVNDGIICLGDCAGLNAGAFSGYAWNTGATTAFISVCPTVTTTYTVTVRNANGCFATTTSTITVVQKTTPSITETDNSGVAPNDGIVCRGDCAGLNAGGGFLSYVWNTGATTQTINVCPTTTTTYTVTVINANGCSASGTSTVIVNANPSVTTTPTNGTCVVTASICANPSGGSGGGYSYVWNTGATTICISPAPAGTYSVTIADGNNCFASGSGSVTTNTTPPSLSCSNNGPLTCTTTSITLTANNCTGAGITYSWSGPGGFASALQCPSVSVAGTYTVIATSTANGCTSICTTVVGSNTTPPSLSCSNNGPLTCTTTSVTLTANNCTGSGITYSWSGPGGFASALQCPSVSVAGTYTVIATSTVNGCTSTCTTVVGSNTTPPSLNCSNNGPLTCTTTSVTLTANNCTGSGITYSWSGPGGFASALQCPSVSVAGTYTVIATSTVNGCTSTCTTVVGSNTTPPSLSCSNNGPLTCTTTSITLTANNCTGSGITYSWSGPGGFASALQCPSVSVAGTYTVTATSTVNGCTTTCTTVVGSITTPPSLSCSNNGPLTCTTTSITLTANNCTGSGITYSWSGPGGFASALQCPSVSVAGTYTVIATSTANGCTSTCTTVVGSNTTPPSLNCSNNGPLTCTTTSVTLTANNCTGSGITYSWSGPGGFASALQCPSVSVAGTYTVIATSTVNGCTSTCTTVVGSNTTPPSLNCSNNGPLTCTTTSVTLTANNCTGSGITYSWSGPGGFASTLQCPSVSVAGTYTVIATSTVNGCTSTCTTVVGSNTTPPSLNCSNNGPLTCTTTSITLTANNCTGSGITYSWSGPGGFASALQCPSVSVAGTYTVTATSTVNGCTTTCTTVVGSTTTPPSLSCSNNGPLTCTTTSITLTANNCTGSGITYSWSGPGGFVSALQCPSVSVAGTYTVTATSTANGCTSTCTTVVGSNTTPPSLNCSNNGPLTCTTTSVTLTANNCTGSGITYSWSGPGGFASALQCPSVSVAGTYTVIATSTVNGCTSTCTTVVGSNTTPPSLSCSNNGPLTCTTTSVTLTANNCTGSGITYSWSGPGGFASALQCPSVSVAGTYTVIATSTVNGCTSTCTTVVGSNTTPPSLSCSNNGPLTCTTTSITLTANNCTGSGITYSWSGPGGFASALQCPSVSVAGTYTVIATATINGCTSTCTTVVGSITTPPSLSCSNNGPLTCITTSITLTANNCTGSGITYSWSGPGGFASALQCPSATVGGTYTVIATSTANGCTSICTTVVGSNTTPPSLTCSNNGPLTCTTTSITLTANNCTGSGITYSWSGPNGFASTAQCPTATVGGTYTVMATSTANGCTSICTTVVGSNTTPPPCSIGNVSPASVICNHGLYSIGTVLDPALYNFSWSVNASGGATGWAIVGSSTGQSIFFNSGDCGTPGFLVTISLTVTDKANGCATTCTTTVAPGPPSCNLSVRPTLTLNCTRLSQYLLASYQTDIINPIIQIRRNGVLLGSGIGNGVNLDSILVNLPGTYVFTIVDPANASNTCSDVVTVFADNNPPALSCSNNGPLTCTTSSVTLNANNCTGSGVAYHWDGPNGFSSNTQCPVVSVTGAYTVVALGLDNGCVSVCSTSVGSNTTPPTCNLVAPSTLPNCGSTGNNLCVSSNGSTYSWSVSGTGWSITSGQGSNCIAYTAGTGPATFTVVVTGSNGCTSTCNVTFSCQSPYWGCTLGFWKNHTIIWDDSNDPISSCVANAASLLGYGGSGTKTTSFATTFGLTAAQMSAVGYNPNMTLLEALQSGGGGFQKLARQGVAALLNTCGLSGNYTYNAAQVLTDIHNAVVNKTAEPFANNFANANEVKPDNCPPAGKATKRLDHGVIVDENVSINAYPNPFSNQATIEFAPNSDYNKVVVELYNLNGELMTTVFSGSVQADQIYNWSIDGSRLAEGVYIYRITTDVEMYNSRLVLIKN